VRRWKFSPKKWLIADAGIDVGTSVLANHGWIATAAIAARAGATTAASHAVRRLLQAVPLPQVSPRQRAGGPPPAPPLVYGQAAPPQQGTAPNQPGAQPAGPQPPRWGERSA